MEAELRDKLRNLRCPGNTDAGYPIHAFEVDLVELIQREIDKARLNEDQKLYEDAINSTSHGHIIYVRNRFERHLERYLETLKEHKEK